MGFSSIGKDYIKGAYTLLDNVFLDKYLPLSDAVDLKVYLYGLYAAFKGDKEDKTLTSFALKLKLNEERIIEAFKYWEKEGIISIDSEEPFIVSYLSVKNPIPKIVKIDTSKYEVFIKEATRLFPEKILSPNELYAFIELMKTTRTEINAMLLIIGYCISLKGEAVSTPYILKVANAWINEGIKTEKAVNLRIEELECNTNSIRMILASLNLKKNSDMDDREYFRKWTKTFGYELDVILMVAKQCKNSGGMKKLDILLSDLHALKATKAEEVEEYFNEKKGLKDLAIDVVKGIGSFYASLDMVIETYILPWTRKGFEKESLLLLSKFCFTSNIKTLDGMNNVVEKFFKKGLVSAEHITSYIDEQIAIDDKIREILITAGSNTFINASDRELYRTWVKQWGYSDEVILEIAEGEKGKNFAMTAINKMLLKLNEKQLFEDQEIIAEYKKIKDYKSQKEKGKSVNYTKNEYSKEQLDSVFFDISALDIDKVEL